MHDKQRTKIERDDVSDLKHCRAFYVEFAPLPQHANFVEQLYAMKDCGIMTADRRTFASPYTEVAFLFPKAPDDVEYFPRIVVKEPRFGHRLKKRPFHGWIFGIKCQLSSRQVLTPQSPFLMQCQHRLQSVLCDLLPIASIVDALDRLCDELATRVITQRMLVQCSGAHTVAGLAANHSKSTRTVHRLTTAATGLPPKRLLAVDRFRRAVRDVAEPDAKLSELSDALGFADQAHMTREFRRHAGLSPGAFQRCWTGARGETVRFVQDDASASRLRLAVLAGRDGERISD